MTKSLIVILVVLLSLVAGTVSAQAPPPPPPPPPPPLIYSSPDKSEIKEFADTEYGFKVSFPGVPEKQRRLGEKVTEVSYAVKRPGSRTSVGILIFPLDIEPHRTELYDSYREELAELTAKGPSSIQGKRSVVTFDREIMVNGVKGREFGYETDLHFTHVAIFVRGKLFYEVKIDVTNWHILKKFHPEVVEAFNGEANRFISSFMFTQ